MDPSPWIKFQSKHAVRIIGSFENKHGERYVLWCSEHGDTLYFTGDEVDWKPKNRLWPTSFMFSPDEITKIGNLLWPQHSIIAGNLKPGISYSPEMEQDSAIVAWRTEHGVPALSWDVRNPTQ